MFISLQLFQISWAEEPELLAASLTPPGTSTPATISAPPPDPNSVLTQFTPPITETALPRPTVISTPAPGPAPTVVQAPPAQVVGPTSPPPIAPPSAAPANVAPVIVNPPAPPNTAATSISNAPNPLLPQPAIMAPSSEPSKTDAALFQSWLKNNIQNTPPLPVPLAGEVNKPPLKKPVPPKPRVIHAHPRTGPSVALVETPPLSYEQSQKIMRDSAPPAGTPPNPDSATAFNIMMQQNMPLSPQQVVRLRQLIDTSQRAAAIPPNVPPKPVSSTLMMNLAPGATPPAIRLAQGYVSSLVFVDSTGAPWPIASFDIGDPKATNIQWDGKSNILLIQAVSPYSDGNMVIRLIGLPTPLTLEIVSGQRVVDYRTDIHVPGFGPNTKEVPIGTPLPPSASQLLLGVLDGIAPPGSRQLVVKGGGQDCQAWLLGDKMYFRSRMTLLSPGWIGKMTSPDGMYAYELQRSSSVLISQYGNPVELKIEGF